jgi:ribose 5-phosphate isomerase B
MKIYVGADHAGFEFKEEIKHMLEQRGFEIIDKGATQLVEEDDYPDFIKPVAEAVAEDKESKGIVFGGSGQGEAIVANRVPGVRAVVYYGGNMDLVMVTRGHNDSNILSIGARFLSIADAKKAVESWLGTPFSKEERHIRRIQKIDPSLPY